MDEREQERALLRGMALAATAPVDALALAAWLDGRGSDPEAVDAALAADPELARALLALREARPETVPAGELARAQALRVPAPRRRFWPVWTDLLAPARGALALAGLAGLALLGHLAGSELGAAQAQREQQALARWVGEDWVEEAR